METKLAFKFLVVLPLILFIDYLIMVLFGCTSCFFSSEDSYICGTYCIIGKIILVISGLIFIMVIFPDLKKLFEVRKNGKTGKEQESI
jgi:putative Mn2+ efflux pump MntP